MASVYLAYYFVGVIFGIAEPEQVFTFLDEFNFEKVVLAVNLVVVGLLIFI